MAYSTPTTVTVDPPSVGGTVNGGTTICSGSTSGLLTLTGQTGTVMGWQSSVSPFTTWTDIANTATTYTSGTLTATTQFRAVVQSGSCAVAYSTPTTVTVDPVSAGGILSPANLPSIFLGQSTGTITLSGYTGTIVNWQRRLGAGVWTDIVNTTTTLTDSPNVTGTWEYRAVIQSGSCPVAYSSSSFVDVAPSNAGAVTGGSSPVCLGSSTGTMTLSGYTGTIVKWQKRVDAGLWTDIVNTTATYSEIPSSAGTWEYRAVVNNVTDMASAPTTIIVNSVFPVSVSISPSINPVC